MKKCTLYCEKTDFAKNAQFRLLILVCELLVGGQTEVLTDQQPNRHAHSNTPSAFCRGVKMERLLSMFRTLFRVFKSYEFHVNTALKSAPSWLGGYFFITRLIL